ncbi:hypothetical protein BH11VER1_BH11VER1_30920 [soil metagenome]
MKSALFLLPLLGLVQIPLYAQVTVVAPTAAPGTVVEVVRPGSVRVLDPVEVRRQLSLAPKIVIVPTAPASVVVSPVPNEVVKTTKTTTVVDTPGKPRRVYNSERSVVIVEDQSQTRELQYVTLPVLFVKETAELLDNESREALQQVAGVILALSKTEPSALFDIEGHTSTDGEEDYNVKLSAARAKRIYDELTKTYEVPPTMLSAHGYGESFPTYPQGTEEQMQQDRRVLVVRAK